MRWDRDSERKAGKAMGIGMSVFALVFGIVWCITVISMGAGFMAIFGLLFVGIAAYRLAVMLKLAKSEGREKEPWERPQAPTGTAQTSGTNCKHCPYCGENVESRFAFCPICGRRLP